MKGFTLLELLIVIAIVALIGGMVSMKFLRVNQTTSVENSTATVSAFLKEARSRTISGQTSGAGNSWGIYIPSAIPIHPVLFVDVDQNAEFSTPDKKEKVFLDENTQVAQCLINGAVVDDCGVLFQAPTGQAYIFTTDSSVVEPFISVEVQIQSIADTSVQESVIVTAPSGLITTTVAL